MKIFWSINFAKGLVVIVPCVVVGREIRSEGRNEEKEKIGDTYLTEQVKLRVCMVGVNRWCASFTKWPHFPFMYYSFQSKAPGTSTVKCTFHNSILLVFIMNKKGMVVGIC